MADPQQVLAQRVHDAIVASFGPEAGDADPLIRPSSFADFQSNAALPLAKRAGRPPREVAAEIAARLDVADVSATPEISGPGFINFNSVAPEPSGAITLGLFAVGLMGLVVARKRRSGYQA